MNRVQPGDGHLLRRFRWWQLFSRSLFHLQLTTPTASVETWSVDVRHGGDADGVVHAQLYRDGRHAARSKVPAAFPVPGGTVEVATSLYGLRRCRFVAPDGSHRPLVPDPASAEGRRQQLDRDHPVLSRALGLASVAVLLVALVLGVPQLAEQLTQVPPVAQRIGTFSSPVLLPAWANTGLVVVAMVASTERALRLRYSWLLDGGLLEGGD